MAMTASLTLDRIMPPYDRCRPATFPARCPPMRTCHNDASPPTVMWAGRRRGS